MPEAEPRDSDQRRGTLDSLRRRTPAAVALVVVVVAGLGWRTVTGGTVAKLGGDVLYATMIYVLVLLVRPATAPVVGFAVSCVACWAVEFLQLTPLPAAVSARSVLGRLVLGSTFHAPDLVAYPVGALIGLLVHLAVRRFGPRSPSRSRSRSRSG